MRQRIDETGKKYGCLTFLNYLRPGGQGVGPIWVLRCDCGHLRELPRRVVVHNQTKTCGRPDCPHMKGLRSAPSKRKQLSLAMKIYGKYVKEAAARNITWCLPPEVFSEMITQPCAYCGDTPQYEPSLALRHWNGSQRLNGVDRLDSKQAYAVDNTVPCCRICNYMKRNYSVEFFVKHISKLYLHLLASPSSQEIT